MKHLLLFSLILSSFEAFAGVGPINLGSVSIGMSKAEYISAVGINPVNCNTYRDSNGKPNRSEMKDLDPDRKTLCQVSHLDKMVSVENIQVNGLSYDVIEAFSHSSESEFLKNIGVRSKAIFLKDSLISLEIIYPTIDLETLIAKYGEPKLVDSRKIEVCQNRQGNEFKNNVGKLDAVWVNGNVRSILRVDEYPPMKTCTDGITRRLYILEEPKQLKIIEDAINKYQKEVTKKVISDSPF